MPDTRDRWILGSLLLLMAALSALVLMRRWRGEAWALEAAWLFIGAGLAVVAWRLTRRY